VYVRGAAEVRPLFVGDRWSPRLPVVPIVCRRFSGVVSCTSLRFPEKSSTFSQGNNYHLNLEDFVYERCLNEAERILASDKDVIVAVKKVWAEVDKQGRKQGFEMPPLADFTALLEGDSRFEFIPSLDENGEPPDMSVREDSPQEEELENLGFYSGDRVKLKSVELTPEVIGNLIRRKVDMTMDALTRAWERRPEGDQETEDQLLDILAKTQKLQREVKTTFSNDKMKRLEIALQSTGKKKLKAKSKAKRPKKKTQPAPKKSRTKKTTTRARVKKTRRT